MDATIRIDAIIQKQLKLKSVELGITQKELANTYILNGLHEDERKNNINNIEDIAKLLNIELSNPTDELNELDIDMFEVTSDEKQLSMDEIKQIVSDTADKKSNVKFTDMLGIVESPEDANSLNEKWESYNRS